MSGSGWKDEIDEIHRRQQLAAEMGGRERVERQRSRGKLTVRERIAALLDAGLPSPTVRPHRCGWRQ